MLSFLASLLSRMNFEREKRSREKNEIGKRRREGEREKKKEKDKEERNKEKYVKDQKEKIAPDFFSVRSCSSIKDQ